jgi:hypothetical protein
MIGCLESSLPTLICFAAPRNGSFGEKAGGCDSGGSKDMIDEDDGVVDIYAPEEVLWALRVAATMTTQRGMID